MSFTAKEVEEKVSEFEESGNYDSEVDGDVYGDLHYFGAYYKDDERNKVTVPGLGDLVAVEAYGGEGKGDDYWVVFRIGDQYFEKGGWYASYDGGELDGELYEVEPVEVRRIEYKAKK